MSTKTRVLCALAFAVVLLGFAHATCTPGYEPNAPFPSCILRQKNAFDVLFASVLRVNISSDFTGQCINITQAAPIWTSGATIGSRPQVWAQVSGCFVEGVLCYNTTLTTFSCGCLEDCLATTMAYSSLWAYAFNNNIVIY